MWIWYISDFLFRIFFYIYIINFRLWDGEERKKKEERGGEKKGKKDY